MTKAFDVSKFRKGITKSISGISTGFNDPTIWLSTGSYGLNYLISGDFYKGVPLGKVTVLAGESGCLPASAILIERIDTMYYLLTVGRLRDKIKSGETVYLSTPDGDQKVTEWFDKGVMDMVVVRTASGMSTRCAVNHMLETLDGMWVPAGNLQVGISKVKTTLFPEDLVTEVTAVPPEECYDFTIDHENHRYWGDGFSSHNSGKSFIASGNIVKSAQSQGIFTVLIDSENSLDEKWLQNLGVDTSEDKLLRISASMIDDVAKIISDFVKDYKANYCELPVDERPKVLFVIDSLGMLMSATEVNQFEAGDMKGDMGRKAKQLKALVTNCVNMFGDLDIGMVVTNHSYASQDQFDPDPKISGGSGFVYASSIVIAMRKLKLKEDEEGNKTSDVRGIRSACKVMKSRYAKPFESIKIDIPWDTGMNPISGLFDLFETSGVLVKEGNRYKYTSKATGEVMKYFRKEWNDFEKMKVIMDEFTDDDLQVVIGSDKSEPDTEEE